MRIVKAKYLSDYKLQIEFDDGKTVIADFDGFLKKATNPMTTQFRDKERFRNAEISHGHLTWEDGEMDISAESIYNGEFSQKEKKKRGLKNQSSFSPKH